MSEPGVFVFVRNGEKEVFADRWGGLMLHREILWGPDALEEFASHFQSVPVEELEYSEQGVVVDFDHRKLYYSADYEKLRIPVVQAAYNKLLAISWPGYELVLQPNGVEVRDDIDAPDHQDVPFADRNETVDESGRVDLGEDEDDSEDATFSDDELVAWVTIISRNANVRHRLLEDLPQEFFKPEKGLAKRIGLLEPAQVPSEKAVFEGAVIDIPNRTLSMWGSKEIQSNLAQIDKRWGDWKVNWLSNGYAAHCELTASLGKFTSEAEAAAQFMPMALTTKRLDMSTFIGAMGGGLKRTRSKLRAAFTSWYVSRS